MQLHIHLTANAREFTYIIPALVAITPLDSCLSATDMLFFTFISKLPMTTSAWKLHHMHREINTPPALIVFVMLLEWPLRGLGASLSTFTTYILSHEHRLVMGQEGVLLRLWWSPTRNRKLLSYKLRSWNFLKCLKIKGYIGARRR